MNKTSNKKANGEGSTRQLLDGSWECIIQSKYLNPESSKPKRIKRKGKTEKEAIKNCKMALQVWEKMYEANQLNKIDKKKTFGSYMEEFIDTEVKPEVAGSSYKSYIYTMNANFYNYKISKLQLSMLNTVEFEVYFDTIIHDKSQSTASFPIQMCKRCCEWLVGKSLLVENYASQAKVKKEKKDEFFRENKEDIRKEMYSYEDIHKFYDSYKNNMSEYSPAIILMLETLMRGQELLALTLDDIDLDNNIITIRSAESERFIDNDKTKGLEKYIKVPKNGETRIAYITPLAREVVEFMMAQTRLKCRDNPNNLLFPSYNRHGKMRSMDSFEMQFKALCDKLGIDRDVRETKLPNGKVIRKGLNVHALRHTGVSLANTAPNSNRINTALMAGHKNEKTQNIYTHAHIEALKSIKTAGDLVLNINEEISTKEDKEKELYNMFLKLKEKFET